MKRNNIPILSIIKTSVFLVILFTLLEAQSRDPHNLERWNIFDVNKLRTKFNNANLLAAGSNQETVYPPKPPAFEYPKGSGISYAGAATLVIGGKSQSDAGGVNPNNSEYCDTGLEEGPVWFWDPHHFESYEEFVSGDRVTMSDDPDVWPEWPTLYPNYTYLGPIDTPGGIDDPNRSTTENPNLIDIPIELDSNGWPFFKINGDTILADQESFSVCHTVNYVPENSTPDYKARWLNVQTTCRGLAWRTQKYEDMIFWVFTVRNMGDTIHDFAMGIHSAYQFVADFEPFGGNNTGGVGGEDRLYYDTSRNLAYGTDDDGFEIDPYGNQLTANQIAWAGTVVLKTPRNLGITSFDAYDGQYLFGSEKENGIVTDRMYLYNLLNINDPDDYDGDGIDGESGFDNDVPRDGIPDNPYKLGYPNSVIATGPYDMLPGEIDTLIVAMVFGVSKEDLFKNVDEAILLANEFNFKVPPPPPAPHVVITPKDRKIILEWDNSSETDLLFEGYRIYRSKDCGASWGEKYITDINGVPISPIPRAQFDIKNGITGIVDEDVPWLNMGTDSGLEEIINIKVNTDSVTGDTINIDTTYIWVDDRDVINGFQYYYWVAAYTHGDSLYDPIETPPEVGVNIVSGIPVVEIASTESHLENIRVVPNPYVATAAWETNPSERKIQFTGLPAVCVIRIFNSAGELVQKLNHNSGTSYEDWNMRTINDQESSSGLYVFHITSDVGEKVGKFVIIY